MRDIVSALLGRAPPTGRPALSQASPALVPLYGTTHEFIATEARAHRTRLIVGLGGLLVGTGILTLLGDMLGLVVYAILAVVFTVAFFIAGNFVWGGTLTCGAYILTVILRKPLPGIGIILAAVLIYRLTEIAKGERAPHGLVPPPNDVALRPGRPATWDNADSHPKTHPNCTDR